MSRMTTGIVDPNIRLGGNHTMLSIADCDGPVAKNTAIHLVVEDTGRTTVGKVVDVDTADDTVMVELDWAALEVSESAPGLDQDTLMFEAPPMSQPEAGSRKKHTFTTDEDMDYNDR